MGKHRTRKEKETAKHQFTLSWEARVKRQKNIGSNDLNSSSNKPKSAETSAQDAYQPNIKRDLFKSLILVSFILCLELVIYLARKGGE